MSSTMAPKANSSAWISPASTTTVWSTSSARSIFRSFRANRPGPTHRPKVRVVCSLLHWLLGAILLRGRIPRRSGLPHPAPRFSATATAPQRSESAPRESPGGVGRRASVATSAHGPIARSPAKTGTARCNVPPSLSSNATRMPSNSLRISSKQVTD